MPEWSNWSGSVTCAPKCYPSPDSEEELRSLVREAGRAGHRVRVHGTGHSFTPIAATDDLLLSLERWTGIESVNRGRNTATIRAGTTLFSLGRALLEHGLAMENLGDVDVQTLAGALSTGTHGTGPTFGNLATQAIGLRLVTADGETLECSPERDAEVYLAARVSLGTLGILSAATLRLLPAFRLHERVWRAPIAETLDKLDQHIATNEHFEFFWYPSLDAAECKTLNTTDGGPQEVGKLEPVTVISSRTTGMAALAENLGDLPGERVGWSALIIPSVRTRKFNEMEYAVPAEQGPACFRRVRERMLSHHAEVVWPVEYRTLAADEAFLSPAHGRATVTISIHQDARLPHLPFFTDIEPIFREYGGRPHWGKVHSLTAADLRPLYPAWDRFAAVRARLDPHGRFLTPYLRRLLVD